MKRTLLLLTLLALSPLMAEEAPPVITVSLPRGQEMRFIPVEVSDNPNIFSQRTFTIGNSRYPSELIARVSIAGTLFYNGKWYIPFCETEVTRAQYAAIMDLPAPSAKEANRPQTNVSMTEVQAFLSKLTAYAQQDSSWSGSIQPYVNEKSSVPFFRLPTATEWQFAARGGNVVDETLFDADHPYGPNIAKHEVFFSASARDSSAKAVKGKRLPNPLGLYDMLGNVSEWVSPLYYFNNQQGRTGGPLICGGNFRTQKTALHSSDRSECEPYREDGSEFSADFIGFRPVISSIIRHKNMSMNDFGQELDTYRNTINKPAPVAPSDTTSDSLARLTEEYKAEKELMLKELERWKNTFGTFSETDDVLSDSEVSPSAGSSSSAVSDSPTDPDPDPSDPSASSSTPAKPDQPTIAQLIRRIQDLEQQLQAAPDADVINERVARAEAQMQSAQNLLRDSERLKAEAAVMMISSSAAHLNTYLNQAKALETVIARKDIDSETREVYELRLRQFQDNITGAKRILLKGCHLLADVPEDIAAAEAQRQLAILDSENPRQAAATRHAINYATSFRSSHQFGDIDQLLLLISSVPAQS